MTDYLLVWAAAGKSPAAARRQYVEGALGLVGAVNAARKAIASGDWGAAWIVDLVTGELIYDADPPLDVGPVCESCQGGLCERPRLHELHRRAG